MDRSWLRVGFVAFVAVVMAWQLIGVTAAALPPNRYSDAVEPTTSHLTPYFSQNWRLFAPNPVGEDRTVRFQASYRDEAGDVVQTDWVDWTAVELDVVHHRVVGGRAGYITNKLIEALAGAHRRLGDDARRVATEGSDATPPSWAALRSQLVESGASDGAADGYVRYERAVARLATDVLLARRPDLEPVAVRYAITIAPVLPFDQRNDDVPRPAPSERLSGWRPASPGDEDQRAAVADFDSRHR